MKKLKIAVDANEANVINRVGSGQYTFHILSQWAENPKHEYHIFLKEPPLDDMPLESKNWQYHIITPPKAWLKYSLPKHLLFSKVKYDIFFAPAHYAPFLLNTKLVVTIHDLAYEYFPELFLKKDLYKLKNWSKKSVRQADHVISVSESTKADIVGLYKKSKDDITVVHNGFDKDKFNPKTRALSQVLKEYNLTNQKYLLFVGTIQPRKNAIRLVQAFHLLKDHGIYKGKLVIAGNPGWLSANTLNAIKESKYKKDIIQTGYVPQADLPTLYKKSDVYVLPSLYEGFGIPALEAMSLGIPVAVSNNSSLPEVVGRAGELFDPYDPADMAESIAKILKNKNRYSEKSLAQAKKFSWAKSASETLKVLEQVALAKPSKSK